MFRWKYRPNKYLCLGRTLRACMRPDTPIPDAEILIWSILFVSISNGIVFNGCFGTCLFVPRIADLTDQSNGTDYCGVPTPGIYMVHWSKIIAIKITIPKKDVVLIKTMLHCIYGWVLHRSGNWYSTIPSAKLWHHRLCRKLLIFYVPLSK